MSKLNLYACVYEFSKEIHSTPHKDSTLYFIYRPRLWALGHQRDWVLELAVLAAPCLCGVSHTPIRMSSSAITRSQFNGVKKMKKPHAFNIKGKPQDSRSRKTTPWDTFRVVHRENIYKEKPFAAVHYAMLFRPRRTELNGGNKGLNYVFVYT